MDNDMMEICRNRHNIGLNTKDEQDIQILFDNYECKEGTFIYYLHEDALFNVQAFWDYYNSITSVIKRGIGNKLDENITVAVVFTYKHIVESFLWHSTPNDGYVIKGYPSDKMSLYMERLHFLIDGYFKGYVLDEDSFDDDLVNPGSKFDKVSKYEEKD